MNTKHHISYLFFTLIKKYKKGSLLVLAAVFANFCNFLYNAYLSRVSGFADFGVVSLIGSFLSLTQIPLSSYTRSITHLSAYRYGKEKQPASDLWYKLRQNSTKPTIVLVSLWVLLIPILMSAFQTPDIVPYIIFTPIWAIGVAASVDSGFLGGSLRFQTLAIMTIIEAVIKLAVSIILVEAGYIRFVYLAIPVSALCSFGYGWYRANKLARKVNKEINVRAKNTTLSKRFFVSSIFSKITTLAFLNMDVLMVKHYLPPVEAGKYALLSTIGKMIYFLGSLFTQFITPLVSHNEGSGKASQKTFLALLANTIVVSFLGVGVLGFYGQYSAIFLFGQNAQAIVSYLPLYTIGMACIVCAGAIVGYHQAKTNHLFSILGIFIAIGMLFGIFLFHSSIGAVSWIVSLTGIFWFVSTLVLHFAHETVTVLIRNVVDLFGIFIFSPSKNTEFTNNPRILILNWRDTKHVWAGGAEVYIHELAKRLVNEGCSVTIFCGNDGKCKRNETLNGVKIIRRGGFYTVYVWACIYYIFRFRSCFDVVIESMNGVPFFTPLYASVPTCLMVHHVHQEVFRKHLRFPLSFIAMFVESKLMPLIYQKQQIITVSESSKKEIIRHHLANTERVSVITPGVSLTNLPKVEKSKVPLFAYVGRLKPYKNVDTLLVSFSIFVKKHPNAQLIIAGWGESVNSLKELVQKLHIESFVVFKGYVSDNEKFRIMGKAWACVHPSSVEGWGITVVEANSMSTPVIGSRVYGLKDSIVHNRTGFLVPVKNVFAFAHAMENITSNSVLRMQMEQKAREWSATFNWDVSAQSLLSLIKEEIVHYQQQMVVPFSVEERRSV